MISGDDFTYALENTRVVRHPEKRLETFSTSVLNYYLVTEDMDQINLSRVREGSIHAERPRIISPQNFSKLLLEGFGGEAERYAEALNQLGHHLAFLQYGFRVKKSDIRTYEVNEGLEIVTGRVVRDVEGKNDPLAAVLTGVDDGWEVCLLKFMMDMAVTSGERNLKDFRDRGLI
ncbi:MAG: hypothetical protein ACFCUX_02535 [Candidatus Methylacidiphilales bacterium]